MTPHIRGPHGASVPRSVVPSLHPGLADGGDEVAVCVGDAAGAGGAELVVDCAGAVAGVAVVGEGG